jgi:hypothetical protein
VRLAPLGLVREREGVVNDAPRGLDEISADSERLSAVTAQLVREQATDEAATCCLICDERTILLRCYPTPTYCEIMTARGWVDLGLDAEQFGLSVHVELQGDVLRVVAFVDRDEASRRTGVHGVHASSQLARGV